MFTGRIGLLGSKPRLQPATLPHRYSARVKKILQASFYLAALVDLSLLRATRWRMPHSVCSATLLAEIVGKCWVDSASHFLQITLPKNGAPGENRTPALTDLQSIALPSWLPVQKKSCRLAPDLGRLYWPASFVPQAKFGAEDGTRTHDINLGKVAY